MGSENQKFVGSIYFIHAINKDFFFVVSADPTTFNVGPPLPIYHMSMKHQQLRFFRIYSSLDSLRKIKGLISGVSEEEIRAVVFNMPSNKSPGRDGYSTKHFKFARSIVGNDVVKAVQSFFLKGFLPKGINSAILVLILKKERATEMKDYRPI